MSISGQLARTRSQFTGKCGSDGSNEEGDADGRASRLFGDAAGEDVDTEAEGRTDAKRREVEQTQHPRQLVFVLDVVFSPSSGEYLP